MTTNVNLPPQLESLVRKKVASGQYASVSEVVREALRLLAERDQVQALKLKKLRRDIKEGVKSGPAIPWNSDDIKKAGRALRAEHTARAN